MKGRLLILVGMVMLVQACDTSEKIIVTGSWVNTQPIYQKEYTSVFIAVLTNRNAAKTTLEHNIGRLIASNGYKVVESSEVFAPNFTKENAPDRETILSKIREAGCDVIFTVALVDEESEARFLSDPKKYIPYPAYGSSFWGYYQYWYQEGYSPGYIAADKNYFLESHLFDVHSGKMLWSLQTGTNNTLIIERFNKDYELRLWARAEKDFFKRQ